MILLWPNENSLYAVTIQMIVWNIKMWTIKYLHSLTTFINMYKNISEYIILCYSERKIITNVYGICIVAGSLH